MTDLERTSLIAHLAQRVSARRLQHILRVETLAVDLARFWKVSERQTHLAALLHDVAKDMPEADLMDMVRHADDPLVREMAATPAHAILHAPAGALVAHRDFGISDPDVLRAIALHTTGDSSMDTLAKIIFLADYCEPERQFPGVEDVRALLYVNLDDAMALALKQTLAHLRNTDRAIDEHTAKAEKTFSGVLEHSHQP